LDSAQVLDLLRRVDALLEGHFELSSGLHSDRYFQCALALSDPRHAESLARALALKLRGLKIDVVVGPALGAVVMAHEVARALGVRGLFTERKDGPMALRRGFRVQPGERALVVEDVVTTGGSAKEVVAVLRQLGAEPVGVGCIVNRSGGNPFQELGLPLFSLAEVTARTWRPEEAPPEFRGSSPVKPGSRPGLRG
jgi:orotate phosphoribosyltransferase